MGTKGTIGVLNGLGVTGSDLRIIMTPTLTNAKANNVPMLVRSPVMSPGISVANVPTNKKRRIFDL